MDLIIELSLVYGTINKMMELHSARIRGTGYDLQITLTSHKNDQVFELCIV